MKSGVFVAKVYSFLHGTTTCLAFPVLTYGPSMIPTFHPSRNIVLAEKISTRSQKLSRGDIVTFQSPEDPNKVPTKRVIGLEGDRVSFVVDPNKNDESRTIVAPKGHVWVQGDYTQNRETRESLVLYLMVLFKADCFGGFGRFKILDQLDRLQLKEIRFGLC